MQRPALAVLFAVLGVTLAAIAVWSALEGGRAWVVGITAGLLGLWMLDLANRTRR